MKVAITGSSGLIGTALVASLRSDGHQVIKLVRRPVRSAGEVRWDPRAADAGFSPSSPGELDGLGACVHLAGAGVADHRWTARYKAEIRASRVLGTRTLATALTRLGSPPETLVSGSAIGWYGDTGGQDVDESAPAGEASSRGWSTTGRQPPSLPPTRASASCTHAPAWFSPQPGEYSPGCSRWPGSACARDSVRVSRS